MPCYAYRGITPVVDATSHVHPLAVLIGDVIVGPECYIGPGASLRGDFGRIVVEGDSSIQDNATIHANSRTDTVIRRGATVAHGAVIHGCDIGESVLVGINAVVLDGAVIGAESLVAALALVGPEMAVPRRSLVAGNPARVVKSLPEAAISWRADGGGEYQQLARELAQAGLTEVAPLPAPEPDRLRTGWDAPPVRIRT